MQTENMRTNSEKEDSMLDIQDTLNPYPDVDVDSSTQNPEEEDEYFNHTARADDLRNERQKSAKKSVSFTEPEFSFASPVPEDTNQDTLLDTSLILSDKKGHEVQKSAKKLEEEEKTLTSDKGEPIIEITLNTDLDNDKEYLEPQIEMSIFEEECRQLFTELKRLGLTENVLKIVFENRCDRIFEEVHCALEVESNLEDFITKQKEEDDMSLRLKIMGIKMTGKTTFRTFRRKGFTDKRLEFYVKRSPPPLTPRS